MNADNQCPNCGTVITANFCGNCGQKKYKRIDGKYVTDELQYLTIHTNKGFFYSLKNILVNPGKTARTFVEGNRVNHYKPIYFAFILSGISAFISFKIVGFNDIMEHYYQQIGLPKSNATDVISFVTSYNSVINLLLIPFFAFFTWISFRKWGQNYYEHVVMNAFFVSFYTLIYIAVYPLLYLFRHDYQSFINTIYFLLLITPLLAIWFYKGFYPDKKVKSIIWRLLKVFLLAFLSYVIAIFFFVITLMVMKGKIF